MNISVANEVKQREMAKDIIGDNIVAEKGPFTFSLEKGGEEIKEVPFVYCRNLIASVCDTIENHK